MARGGAYSLPCWGDNWLMDEYGTFRELAAGENSGKGLHGALSAAARHRCGIPCPPRRRYRTGYLGSRGHCGRVRTTPSTRWRVSSPTATGAFTSRAPTTMSRNAWPYSRRCPGLSRSTAREARVRRSSLVGATWPCADASRTPSPNRASPPRTHVDPSLQGVDPRNVCNRAGASGGVQLELSVGFRRLLFEDLSARSQVREACF